MQRCRLPTACLLALFPLLSPYARTQNSAASYVKRPITAVKTATPPAMDGVLADPAWLAAPKATDFSDRQQGSLVADQTVARILYDDKYLYVAFHCKDSQPDKITARETIRDSKYTGRGDGDSEDNVEVTFDPFQTHRFEDFTRFSLNAIGTPSASLGGGRANKTEWKGDWDGAVKRVTDGWTAEMRIPWAILNFPASRQPINMGINFTRFQARTRIQSVWSNIGPQFFTELEGVWTGVQVPAGAFHPKLSLLPYLLPHLDRSGPGLRSGLDARYTITPELTAVGSVNPDFATIEGAVEGIQFQRGERRVDERRPFFLEGRDYFGQGGFFSGVGSYFYSNRIENFDVGTKIYGKVTPTDTLGLLHTIDFGKRSDLVARVRHDFTPTISSSLFLMNKSATDDNNTVAVLSQEARWGKFGVSSDLGISTGREAGGPLKTASLSYRDKLLFWSLRYMDVSPLFRDANGLIPFNDYRGFRLASFWDLQWRKGFWRSFSLFMFPQYTWHADGRPFRRGGGFGFEMQTRSDWGIGLDVNHEKFDDQTDSTIGLSLTNGVSNRFRQWGIRLTTGKSEDRPYSFVGPLFSVRVLKKLDLSYNGSLQNFDGTAQQHVLTMNYEISPTRAFGGRVVVQNADTNWYLSYHSSGAKGTEVFFIVGDPNAARFTERVAVKFVFAL